MEPPADSDLSTRAPRQSVSAVRAVAWLSGAKLYFMLAGAALQILLPTVVSPAAFGAFVVVASLISPINNILVTGTIQTVSRAVVSHGEHQLAQVLALGRRMHRFVAWPLVSLFFLLSAAFLHWYLRDGSKQGPVLASGSIALCYAYYAVYVGAANGLRRFHWQAAFDVSAATLRALLMLGAAWIGLDLWGILGGWIAAALAMVAIAGRVFPVAAPPPSVSAEARDMAKQFALLAMFLLGSNALLWADTWLVKRYTAQWYSTHVEELAQLVASHIPWLESVFGVHWDVTKAADTQVAFYAAAQNIARLTYQAIIAITFVVFPLMTRATFEGDRERTRRYLQNSFRFSMAFVLAMILAMIVSPYGLLDIPYHAIYAQQGAEPLVRQAWSNGALALLTILATVGNAAGLERYTWKVAGAVLLAILAGGSWVSGLAESPAEVLTLVATSTMICLFAGCLGLAALLFLSLGTQVPWGSMVRMAAAMGLATFIGRQLAGPGIAPTLLAGGVAVAVYGMVLVALGEFPWRKLWRAR